MVQATVSEPRISRIHPWECQSYPGIHAIPIQDTSCELVVFYNATDTNPYIQKFLQTVRAYFRTDS